MIYRFLQRNDIKGNQLGQRQRHGAVGLPRRGFPPRIEVSVQRQRGGVGLIGTVSRELRAVREVGGKRFVDHLPHPAQGQNFIVGYQSARVRRKVQDQISVAADGRVIDIHQLRDAAGMLPVRPKPGAMVEHGEIHFRRIPPEMRTGYKFVATAQIAIQIRPAAVLGRSRQRNHTPLRGTSHAAFIAHPPHVRPFAHDDRPGLQPADQVIPRVVVVCLMDARIGIRAIKPDFPDRPVLRQQLVKLIQEITVVVVHSVSKIRESRRRRAALRGVALKTRRISRNCRKHLGALVAVITRRIFRIRPQLVKVGG